MSKFKEGDILVYKDEGEFAEEVYSRIMLVIVKVGKEKYLYEHLPHRMNKYTNDINIMDQYYKALDTTKGVRYEN